MKALIINKLYPLIDYPNIKFRLPAILGLLFLFLMPSIGFKFSTCLFYSIFDIPCPACGLTRSMSSILNFDFSLSLFYHPLGSIVLLYLIVTLFTNQPDFLKSNFTCKSKILSVVFSFRFIAILFIITWFIKIVLMYDLI
jgi:uncharacterized protein DUF2752